MSRATILIVDDEAYVRNSLSAFFRRRGFAVRLASGFEEALEPASLDGASVVITDLRMPGRNGDELVAALARLRPELPVLVLTGNGTVASAVECMKAGSVDVLEKPAHPERLLDAVKRALGEPRRGGAPVEEPRTVPALREALRRPSRSAGRGTGKDDASEIPVARPVVGAPERTGRGTGSAEDSPIDLRGSLAATERRLLEEALERSGGVRRRAAKLLGIDERNLAYFLRKHGLLPAGRADGEKTGRKGERS